MTWKPLLLVSVVLVASVTAGPTSTSVVHERRAIGDQGNSPWVKRDVANRYASIPVRIGLVQRNLERGEDYVMSVSDPSSPSYGRYWTGEDVHEQFAPDRKVVDDVLDWLHGSGIANAQQSDDRGWITFDAPLHRVEDLLKAKYQEYYHEEDNTVRLGCDEYSLPEHIVPHIDYVTPGISLLPSAPHPGRSYPVSAFEHGDHRNLRRSDESTNTGANSLEHCDDLVTPACYRALYDLPAPNHTLSPNNFGIYSLGWSAYDQKSLDQFFTAYTNISNGTHPDLVSINGATAPKSNANASAEANLDFMVAYGLLGDVEVKAIQGGLPSAYKYNNLDNDALMIPLLDAVDGSFCTATEKKQGFQCGGTELSQVISMSYGDPELFMIPAKKQKRICNELMKLALQGHTVVIADVDYGVGGDSNYNTKNPLLANGCAPQDLNNTGSSMYNGTIFMPDFPANCPYVLAVGATMLNPGQNTSSPESVMILPKNESNTWSNFTTYSSGGGFSNYFPRPSYQDAAVTSWQKNHAPSYPAYVSNYADVTDKNTTIGKNGGIYNSAGRGFPDVSANGYHFPIFVYGVEFNEVGCSVAAPAWGSVIALLNEERKAVGKGAVGFVNPVLYKHPEVFNDVKNGSNPGCGTEGFKAVEGWDPATGLGTPNWPRLKELFLSLP